MPRFEYRSATAPLIRSELDSLGAQGWELAAVDGSIAWFKRNKDERLLQQQGEQHAAERAR